MHFNSQVGDGTVVCRKRCEPGDRTCLTNNTHTILYSSYALPSVPALSQPMPLTTLRFVSGRTGQTVRTDYRILSGNTRNCFDVRKRNTLGWLRLVQPVIGPDGFMLLLQMDALGTQNRIITRHLAYVDIDVSVYTY
ncbi:hypothetical protein Pcinc_010024 [Petrolisthes cinctipes]|uniref:Fibulin C-terminal Ig-like domain-containing protein n=1 Tax=Petrolisthes cinctipes TaxID=88211 RepID=A0AAE1KUW8_PETCI|nr:hypothetical protein Pcinc_020777 [Petrolisthes cinctipes]KAK3885789.1 hypothetical protein Pcinc_010024 [Petrolisthes cinctipes]